LSPEKSPGKFDQKRKKTFCYKIGHWSKMPSDSVHRGEVVDFKLGDSEPRWHSGDQLINSGEEQLRIGEVFALL
jgi:hypothetical protein